MILFILLKAFTSGYIDRVQLLTQNQIMCIQETARERGCGVS